MRNVGISFSSNLSLSHPKERNWMRPPSSVVCSSFICARSSILVARCGKIFEERYSGTQNPSRLPAGWRGIIARSNLCERDSKIFPCLSWESCVEIPQHDEAPPAYRSPSPSFNSPGADAASPSNRTAATSSASGSYGYPQLQDSKESSSRQESAPTIASGIQSTLGGAASSVANAIPLSSEDLRAQLSEAKATIAKLRQQGEERGLGQSKDGNGSTDTKEHGSPGLSTTGIQQPTSEGVPIQIVAALCLLSFLLAYFFFWPYFSLAPGTESALSYSTGTTWHVYSLILWRSPVKLTAGIYASCKRSDMLYQR